MANVPQPGRVVKSKAGRDKGRNFMICTYDGGEFVYLVDGVLRKFSNPKKKKLKHVEITDCVLEPLAIKLNSCVKIFDAELRRALEESGHGNQAHAVKED